MDEVEYEVDTGIVKVGGIDRFDDFTADGFFGDDVNPQSARVAVAKLKTLEEMLKAAEQFGQYACEFALKEAHVYIEISKYEGAEAKLTDGKRRLVEWIRLKTDLGELDDVLMEVAEGKRIHLIKRREDKEHSSKVRSTMAEGEYKRISDIIVKKLDADDCTTLTPAVFYENWNTVIAPNPNTVKAYVELTRDKILRKDGCALGDDNGTYVSKNCHDRSKVAAVVQNKLEALLNSLMSLAKYCQKNDFRIPDQGLGMIRDALASLEEPFDANRQRVRLT